MAEITGDVRRVAQRSGQWGGEDDVAIHSETSGRAPVVRRSCNSLAANLGSAMTRHPAVVFGRGWMVSPAPEMRTTVALTSQVLASGSRIGLPSPLVPYRRAS